MKHVLLGNNIIKSLYSFILHFFVPRQGNVKNDFS